MKTWVWEPLVRRLSISLYSYPEKLSALKSLSSYSFLEWSTFTHCINFEESLILTQRSMNRLWNLDILQLTNAKNKTVVSGDYLFLTPHFSTQAPRWIVYMCTFSPSKRTGTFVKLGHPSSGFNSEGATQAKPWPFFSRSPRSLHGHHQTSPCAAALFFFL